MKNPYRNGILIAVCALLATFVLIVTDNNDDSCSNVTTSMKHTVTIENNVVEPVATTAKRCDTLTIINNDGVSRKIAFGQHDNHITYDRITEKDLAKGEKLTITLNSVGDFLFHDHGQEEVQGTFLVTK